MEYNMYIPNLLRDCRLAPSTQETCFLGACSYHGFVNNTNRKVDGQKVQFGDSFKYDTALSELQRVLQEATGISLGHWLQSFVVEGRGRNSWNT